MAKLADELGLPLLPWQRHVLDDALAVDDQGRWIRSQVGILVARQNGKSALVRILLLAHLYVFGSRQIISIAQNRTLAIEHLNEAAEMAKNVPWMARRIKRHVRNNGQEALEVWCEHYPDPCPKPCERVRKWGVRAASGSGPRGASADVLFIDELREIDEQTMAAARPLVKARPNSQIIICSNAGDVNSVVLNELRTRALADPTNRRLGWYEYSAPGDDPTDPDNLAWSNPAMGHLFDLDKLQDEIQTSTYEAVQTEVLCRWVSSIAGVWPMQTWGECRAEIAMTPGLPTWMAIDVNYARDRAYLVTVQEQPDKRLAVYCHEFGNLPEQQLIEEIATLARTFQTRVVGYDPNACGYLAPVLSRAGVPVAPTQWSAVTFAMMCDQTLGAMRESRLVHPGSDTLDQHLASCVRQPTSDGGWRIRRRATSEPISAAVAMVLAVGHASAPQADASIIVV